MSSGKIDLTPDEIVALLKKSYEPTVLIEGKDDIVIYRKLEDISEVSVLQTGGRNTLISVFNRRSEFHGKKVAFIADQDCWCVTGIPSEYIDERLIFTSGYSIENDIFIDINIINMMNGAEKELFNQELNMFVDWYSLAVKRFITNGDQSLKDHPNKILDDLNKYNEFCKISDEEKYPCEIKKLISDNPILKIRGKSLFDLALRQLGNPNRNVVHKNPKIFFDFAAANPGKNINKIFSNIKRIFG